MRTRVLSLSALLLLTASSARPATVRGVLDHAGYVVNGVTKAGNAVRATPDAHGRFKLTFPGTSGQGATLQLISTSGLYFGPVVLKHKGNRAYINLSGRSVNLKLVKVLAGYAVPRRVAGRAIDRTTYAAADTTGKPLGASKLGVVTVPGGTHRRLLRTAAADASAGLGEDTDGDGIPDLYDADADGDLRLNGVDPDSSSNATAYTTLFLSWPEALNINTGSVTQDQIDANLSGPNRFAIYLWFFRFDAPAFSGHTITGAHVDCFGLPWCRPGDGTAVLSGQAETPAGVPLDVPWISYNADGSGFPNLYKIERGPDAVWAAGIQPRVTTADMHPGDAFNVVFDTDGGDVTVPASMGAYFVTVPAITSYDVGAGPVPVTYPVGPSDLGTSPSNPIQMTSEQLTVTFWRPQRPAITGAESGSFIDMGHLHYGIPLDIGSQEFGCPADYSNLSSTLSAGAGSGDQGAAQLFPLTDSADDAAPDASQTLSFTLDLGACLDRNGISKSGRVLQITLTATGEAEQGGVDRAGMNFVVQLP
jgi:hypothetical protein